MFDLRDRQVESDRESIRLSGHVIEVAQHVAGLRHLIVNSYLVGNPRARDRSWILVDTGLPNSAEAIRTAARERFGRKSRPQAIILTHGHFDHVGAVRELVREWDVPVYAHRMEMPYLTGRSDYPPPDPTVGGGLMATMSRFFPNRGIDLGRHVHTLPSDGAVPGAEGWRWIHTPGHTPGHISLFRDADRTLIAGDAFVTVKQESFWAVMSQSPEVNRPPAYFTSDWRAARRSVRALAALRPYVVATGHGQVMCGGAMRNELDELAQDFQEVAVPEHGRYVARPALADESGVRFVPPPAPDAFPLVMAGVGVAIAAAILLSARRKAGDRNYERTPAAAPPTSW